MRKYVTVALCGIGVLVACEQKGPAPAQRKATTTGAQPADVSRAKISEVIQPAPQFIDHAVLGTQLGPDGVVSAENLSIPAGKPVYLTMFLRESPAGLQTSAVWTTMDKKPLRTERKVMNGAKTATFGFKDPKIKPGRYRVVGYWGGNIATEREFEIVGSGKAKRKKG
ncbi:MAG TPA: hypothetical protein VII12_02290 [Thermoanaerobaculia bacterium]